MECQMTIISVDTEVPDPFMSLLYFFSIFLLLTM